MKFYISTFYNIRYLKPNQIPISTAIWDPKWLKLGPNEAGIFTGIKEELLSPMYLKEEDCICQKNCPYRGLMAPCRFLTAYDEYLASVDFKHIMDEFRRVAEDVRKITNYTGEPDIVLLVYEAVENPCSERAGLKKLFRNNGLELIDFTKETNNEQIF